MGKGRVGASLLVLSAVVAACGAQSPAALISRPIEAAPARTTSESGIEHPERVAPRGRDFAIRLANEAERWRAMPVAADNASELANQLITAERAVRDPSVTGTKLAFMGHLQQLVYMRLLERPDLRDAVYSTIAPDVRFAADFNLAAGANLWLFSPTFVTDLPEWRVVSPAPIDDLLSYYREAEAEFGVPWYYLASINLVETRMGRIRGDSYAGAQGPMQFMPATWEAYGEGNIHDPRDAIRGAARYLRAMGAPDRMSRALWWYNHDDEYIDAVIKYAEVMRQDPNAFRGYYGWQVYFITAAGVHLLHEGWSKT